jgi:hypothetical protein
MTDPEAKTPAYLLFFLEVFSVDFDFRILDSCAHKISEKYSQDNEDVAFLP